jgi:hypothetical protein
MWSSPRDAVDQPAEAAASWQRPTGLPHSCTGHVAASMHTAEADAACVSV